jgi:DNA replication protein DnaC
MEKVNEIIDRVKPVELESSLPRANTKAEPLSWSSETIEKYLRHWGIADDVIEGSLLCVDQAKSLSVMMETNHRGLFLHGPQGRGKTTVAAAVLRYEIERWLQRDSPYRSIQFVFIPDLLLELQSCFAPGSEKIAGDVIYRIAEYDFVVLDGAGEGGRPSEFVVGAMGTLIHHRDAVRKTKRTIVTSNYNVQALGERLDARIASRIANMCDEVPFTGRDRRLNR